MSESECTVCQNTSSPHGVPPVTAQTPEPERDLSNAQLVGRNGHGMISIALPRVRMTRQEALVHAAWLVVIADGELEISGIIAAIGGDL